MYAWGDNSDFESARRQRKLSNQQPFDFKGSYRSCRAFFRAVDWVKVITYTGCLTFCVGVWYYVFVHI